MELNQAIEVILSANGGNRPVTVTEFIEATNVVLDAMRSEITTSGVVKWCLKQDIPFERNE